VTDGHRSASGGWIWDIRPEQRIEVNTGASPGGQEFRAAGVRQTSGVRQIHPVVWPARGAPYALLKAIEYPTWWSSLRQIYAGLISLVFRFAGIWLGLRITGRPSGWSFAK